jgi:hypothetical protein
MKEGDDEGEGSHGEWNPARYFHSNTDQFSSRSCRTMSGLTNEIEEEKNTAIPLRTDTEDRQPSCPLMDIPKLSRRHCDPPELWRRASVETISRREILGAADEGRAWLV